MNNQSKLRENIFSLLQSGHNIEIKWNCGGDEVHIAIFLDGEELDEYKDPFTEAFDMYLINYLNLPDAGEFSLEGKGKIIEEGGVLYIVYESILNGYMDYNIETEESLWKEVNKMDEEFSGKNKLFE